MTMLSSLARFGKRQLHTLITSREVIKPLSPTPSTLKTYNLSFRDQLVPNIFIPMVLFYQNIEIYHSSHDKTLKLKNSLSQTLTKYYPFAGRHAKTAPTYVDCNDEGAEFLEASIYSTLSDFLQNLQHEDLEQFFPYGQIWNKSNLQSDIMIPLSIQVNHFECGGVALAVSLSHKIADASSLIHFLNHWAKVSQLSSDNQKHEHKFPISPQFISFQNRSMNFESFSYEGSNDWVTKSFMFPNAKINELKLKVKAMTAESEQPITNPTRVEVLIWLLYKCAIAAASKNNSGIFKPAAVGLFSNIREKMIEPLPEHVIGNITMMMQIQTRHEMEMKPNLLINELKKQKMQSRGLKNIETFFDNLINAYTEMDLEEYRRQVNNTYMCSPINRYAAYEIDFGWGKPIRASLAGNARKNAFILMDAPNEEGIEAHVCLGQQDMDVFQSDPELLAFANF